MEPSQPTSLSNPPREPSTPSTPLGASLATNLANYTLRNPRSLRAYNDSCQHLPGGNTRTTLHSSPFPLTFASGASCTLTTLDGDTYTDFLGEYTAGIYGHNHPIIHAAITSALDRGWNFGGTNAYEKQLARLVCERFAPAIETVRFTNSGTEANTCALAAAIAYTRRDRVLVFRGAYHGSTLAFPASTHSPDSKSPRTLNLPNHFLLAPYNDIPTTRALLAAQPPHTLAAILVEPMLGSGGAIPGDPPFLRFLRAAATESGALLIFDEVMTSRLGYRGLGHKLGIRPDLMTLGKWVGGGMSFGAFGGRREIMAMFDPRSGVLSHAGTFNNNVVSMSAGVAGLGVLDEEVLGRLNALGERTRALVEGVLRKHGVVRDEGVPSTADDDKEANGFVPNGNVYHHHHLLSEDDGRRPKMYITGLGSLMHIHFTGPDRDVLQALFFHHMLEENIYVPQRGFIALSIEIRLRHVGAFAAALERFVVRFGRALVFGGE